jgi:thymidylate synthase (FAD)
MMIEPSMDFMPCSAARVSFGNEDKTGEDVGKDKKLMKYLADHKHMTPFEYQHATFLIECPLFIRSQIHRHRTFSYNEISRRYTDENLEFWIPDTFRGQNKSNRQASSDEVVTMIRLANDVESWDIEAENAYMLQTDQALAVYTSMITAGIAREIARAVLPQSLLTKFYMGGNLRNWAHFIELRRDEHAQKEVQIVAVRIAEKLRELWPASCDALGI